MSQGYSLPDVERVMPVRFTSEHGDYTLQCDRAAISPGGELYMLSASGPARVVAGAQALLNSEQSCTIATPGMRFARPGDIGDKGWEYVFRIKGRYERAMDRLRDEGGRPYKFDRVHALFVTRAPNFLLNSSDQAVGVKLADPGVCTTPFLPEWVPEIARELRRRKFLVDAFGFQCRCAAIACKPGDIDAVVLDLGRKGVIRVPG